MQPAPDPKPLDPEVELPKPEDTTPPEPYDGGDPGGGQTPPPGTKG